MKRVNYFLTSLIALIFTACSVENSSSYSTVLNSTNESTTDQTSISSSIVGFTFDTDTDLSLSFDDNSSLYFGDWAISGSDSIFVRENATFNNSTMSLALKDTISGEYNTTGAHAQTTTTYGYGKYEITMKPAHSNGYVSSFFLFWDNGDLSNSWNEIDIEFIKADNQVQFNNFDKPNSMHEKLVTLDFNATASSHKYTIEYTPSYIKYFVDETLLHTQTTDLVASQNMKIMMNIWKPATTSGTSWAGTPQSSMLDLTSEYSQLSYYPLKEVNSSIPLECLNSATLETWGLCVKKFMPLADSNIYEAPSNEILIAFKESVTSMLNGKCSMSSDSPLKEFYSLFTFKDAESDQSFCILYETNDSDQNSFIDKGWGSVVVNTTSTSTLAIEIPHPEFDSNTLLQGIVTLKRTNAKALLLAGTHRNASTTASTCQSSYKQSDVAHNENSCFFEANIALSDHLKAISSSYKIVQFHGKATTSCSDTNAFITNGTATSDTTTLNSILSLIKTHYSSWTATTTTQNNCNLIGSTNVEGRYINSVAQQNVCDTSANSSNDNFIHIEQASDIRDGMYWVNILK
ncbi:MAG: family 16 glycosylhydrolase [Helicobacteraceae bacterium]|nr:family 16 glycosylhydrolase [Helicobacteraceae bacterium]